MRQIEKTHLELGLGHGQLGQLLFDSLAQCDSRLAAAGRNDLAPLAQLFSALREAGGQILPGGIGIHQLFAFAGDFLPISQQAFDRIGILAFQVGQQGEPFFYFVEAGRVKEILPAYPRNCSATSSSMYKEERTDSARGCSWPSIAALFSSSAATVSS